MQTIWETYRNQGLMVLAIGAGEDEATAQTWIDTYGLTHPVLADPTGAIYTMFGAGFVPHNSIIDGNVILQYTEIGYDQAAVIAMIEQLLLGFDHTPMPDSEDSVNPYTVNCAINSVAELVSAELLLHWNLDGGAVFNEVTLTPVVGDVYTNDFTAEIPAQPYGTTVYYYLSAANTVGRSASDPGGAPTTLHSFYVGVDSTPPVIEHVALGDQVLITWPATVSATVTDNQGVDSVVLEFMIDGGSVETVPMLPTGGGVYSADFFGSVAVGDMVEYRITASDVAATPNGKTDPVSGYHDFSIVEQRPVYIFRPATPASANAIAAELDALGIVYDIGNELPANCSLYRAIFACLGVYATNYTLTSAEGQALADFLDLGGHLYMEGGDTWAYDSATAVHPYFNIDGLADGSGDAGPIEGAAGTFTAGMYFTYGGGNSYIDRIAPLSSAFPILVNVTPVYMNGIAYDGGTYRTVGASIEFGGLADGTYPSTKNNLLSNILDFFDMFFEDGFESGDTSGWSATYP